MQTILLLTIPQPTQHDADLMSLTLNTRITTLRAVVEVSGELWGGEQSQPLYNTVTKLLEDGHKEIVLNIKNVFFANSSGVGLLIRLHVKAEKHGAKLIIANPNPNLKKVFETMNLHQVMHIQAVDDLT
ncbi:MAG: STAS domain-containing protein [Chloroherpetonaceae bacterium]|nr:STAS domain-containing protein [Chloroherpetonaceae bacterium]MCS7212370.1 STAS domain-containing protein [Chloroherpetonaceae bacterium]MDW8018573.1 STAS domain-containing protein [Chloroherpetonaceae bacterium]MDW8467326.1 STAS domain-containing protein [Chloroherpetonaceae bacterium]